MKEAKLSWGVLIQLQTDIVIPTIVNFFQALLIEGPSQAAQFMSPVSFSVLSRAVRVIYAPPRNANTQHNRIFLSRIVINNIGLRLSDSETE